MAARFFQLLGWSLGDVPLSISIDGDVSAAIRRLNGKIQAMGPIKLQIPMYSSEKDRCAGYIKGENIYLIAPTKWYGISSVFSLDRIFYFEGKFSYGLKELNGKFKLIIYFRIINIIFRAFLFIFATLSFSSILWNVLYSGNLGLASRSFISLIFAFLFLSLLIAFARLGVHLTTRSRIEVKNFLMEALRP